MFINSANHPNCMSLLNGVTSLTNGGYAFGSDGSFFAGFSVCL